MAEHEHVDSVLPPEPNVSPEAHDVLAAEQFAMPAPQAAWHASAPRELPPEPNASDEPHDVLAAEQFAMPAPPPHVEFQSPPLVPMSDDVAEHAAPGGVLLVRMLRAWRDRRRLRRG